MEFDEYKMTQGTKQELIEVLERVLGIKKEKDEYQSCFYKLAHYDLVKLLKAINKLRTSQNRRRTK